MPQADQMPGNCGDSQSVGFLIGRKEEEDKENEVGL